MLGWFIRFIEKAYSIDLSPPVKKPRVVGSCVIIEPAKGRFLTQEKVQIGDLVILRKAMPDIPFGSHTNGGQTSYLGQYRYWCPKCGTILTEGPCGGVAVNAVCKTCKINYGCLPGYWGDD